jgi:hypothetical protein
MKRKLILISNPGNPSHSNYVRTTEDAIRMWESFFRSPIGGYWEDDEIAHYGEDMNISPEKLRRLVAIQCDYSIVVFCGHGCCTKDEKDAIQLPVPTDENVNLFPVEDFFGNTASSIRRTVILDACRTIIPYTSRQLFEERQYSSIYRIDGIACREYYNSLIMQASPHVEILYSTSEHHKAYGTLVGSQYADTTSNLVRTNSLLWKAQAINNRLGHFCYTMCDLQKDLTSNLVNRNVQIPEYRIIGKAGMSFPFVAMHLPTDRILYNDDAVVEFIND